MFQFLYNHYTKVPRKQLQYHIDNNILNLILCKACQTNPVNWSAKNKQYSTYCSSKCAHSDPVTKQKREQTCLTRYGVKSNLQLESNKVKQQQTMINKYGVDNFAKSNLFNVRYEQTCLERYGVTNVSKLEETQEKIDQTHFERYGRKRSSQIHIPQDIVDLKNNKELMEKWHFEYKMPLSVIAEQLGVNHSQLIVHFRNNLDIDIQRHSVSYPETEIYNFVKSLCPDAAQSNRTLIAPKELDIVIPSHNIAIEFNGLAWHTELKGKDKNYHKNKTLLCNKQNYQLIHIFGNEWTHKQELVKSRLRSKLGQCDRIYARKCKVVELDNVTRFLDENHIQGSCSAAIKLGLVHDNDLVSVMTLGKPRFSKKYDYELIRFANKQNINVVGGASKLFAFFCARYKPKSVISYCDLRWNTGEVYNKLGFEQVKVLDPTYWYVSNYNQLHHRTQYQRNMLSKKLACYDKDVSVWQNMINNGFDRIWDCGNSVWLYQ